MLALFGAIIVAAGLLFYIVVLPLQALFWFEATRHVPPALQGPNRDLWEKHAVQAMKGFWGGTIRDNEEFLNELPISSGQFESEDAYIEGVIRATIEYRHRQRGGA